MTVVAAVVALIGAGLAAVSWMADWPLESTTVFAYITVAAAIVVFMTARRR